jgi:Lrp/AsnC family transcriptional regulator for asnA, asnC and gidA
MINEKKIDETDAQILNILLKESRTSFTDLAEICQISDSAARMRYNRLKEAGIITGANMHINPKFWGYEYTVDIRVEPSLSHEEEVLAILRKKRYILDAAKFGKNIMGYAVLTSLDNLRSIIEEMESNPEIKYTDALVWIQSQKIYYPENLIIKPFNSRLSKSRKLEENSKSPIEADLDQIDRQIVKTLAYNSRTPFNRIAQQLHVSTHNVIQRYKKLWEKNIFTLSTITVNLSKLGYNGNCVTFIKLETKTKISEIHQQLLKLPNATLVVAHMGAYDLRVEIPVETVQDILGITEQIRRIPGIEKTETIINECIPKWPAPLYNKLLG